MFRRNKIYQQNKSNVLIEQFNGTNKENINKTMLEKLTMEKTYYNIRQKMQLNETKNKKEKKYRSKGIRVCLARP